MRVWLDPEKVAALNLTASDVVRAIREQNVQVAAGQLGAPPAPNAADFQLLIDTQGRLVTEEEFENIVVKTGEHGEITRLRDVARVELGATAYALRSLLDNKPAVALPIFQLPGTNAIEISDDVRAKMAELAKDFPEGIDYDIVYDPTVFVRDSIDAVVHTLFEALAARRARRDPVPADVARVDHSARGRAGVARRHVRGDARCSASRSTRCRCSASCSRSASWSTTRSSSSRTSSATSTTRTRPIEAAHQAMREVTSPIIATALVLCAVFVPTAFISGLTGQFYKQFALTIAICTVISAFNSLTLSPALAAVLLKPHGAPPDRLQRGIDARVRLAVPARSIAASNGSRMRYVGVAGSAAARAPVSRSRCTAACWSSPGSASRACRAASSRSRTSSTSSRSRSCRRPRRSIAPRA